MWRRIAGQTEVEEMLCTRALLRTSSSTLLRTSSCTVL
ncbi:hypothetical protein RISK_002935 [Rhodopirellula islandica]|uniref:Uncharacterized protein n=1 Tax=Rhodopirellula islandica TaxID=595434 RepID=A0A0J1BF04_RHOIS|nr:hypothetical protein RISK_002935 [Rhodopirellula islandica]